MKANKLIIIFFFIINVFTQILAQPADYDDFFKTINSLTDEKLCSRLLDFQRKDPHFANIYAQLGTVAHRLMIKTDPLKDFDQAVKCADNGILYLSLFTHFMTDNESRANKSFYENLPIAKADKHYSNPDLVNYITGLTQLITTYRDSLKMTYRTLEQSKEYYGRSIALFKSLNVRFNSLNEVLLRTDSNLIVEINKLEQLFDSTIYYFKTYTELTKTFPLEDYHQKYVLKPIKTFRLDGLSNSNFLLDEFEIWDFGTWVDEVLTTYKADILPLRDETAKINQWLVDNEIKLKDGRLEPANALKEDIDEKFIFKLGKYDNNSLVRELFAYRSGKIKFLAKSIDPLNSKTDSVIDLFTRKTRYYHDLALNKQLVDSFLTVYESTITQDRIDRFKEFFNTAYRGKEGLLTYITNQKEELNEVIGHSFENFKSFMKFQKDYFEKPNYAKFRGEMVPTFSLNSYFEDKHRTNDVFRISGKPVFISGFEVTKTSAVPFIAYIESGNKVKWFKQIDKPSILGKERFAGINSKIYGHKGGCVGVFCKQIPEIVNNFAILDSTGKLESFTTIPISEYPVFLNYDDINQRALIAFQGKDSLRLDEMENSTVCLIDSIGNISWKCGFDLAGNIIDIIKTDNLYQVFLNYKSYNINGKKGKAGSDALQWGTIVVNIDDSGSIKEITPIKQSYSFHVTNIVKLSGQSICLIGYKTSPDQPNGPLFFSIITTSGKIVFSN